MAKNNGHRRNRSAAVSSHRYVPCRVEPGMFRGEWLVHVDAVNPQDPENKIRVQLLVDESEVADLQGTPRRHQPATGWLRVSLASKAKGLAQVVLPQPAIPVGSACVCIFPIRPFMPASAARLRLRSLTMEFSGSKSGQM